MSSRVDGGNKVSKQHGLVVTDTSERWAFGDEWTYALGRRREAASSIMAVMEGHELEIALLKFEGARTKYEVWERTYGDELPHPIYQGTSQKRASALWFQRIAETEYPQGWPDHFQTQPASD